MTEYEAKSGGIIHVKRRRTRHETRLFFSFLSYALVALFKISFFRFIFPATKYGSSGSEQQAGDEDENRAGTLPGQLLRGVQVAT